MEDRCVCCGDIIPEGRFVCSNCEKGDHSNEKQSPKQNKNNIPPPPPSNVISNFFNDYFFSFLRCFFNSGGPWSILSFVLDCKWLIYVSLGLNILSWINIFDFLHLIKSNEISGAAAGQLPLAIFTCLISTVLIFLFVILPTI